MFISHYYETYNYRLRKQFSTFYKHVPCAHFTWKYLNTLMYCGFSNHFSRRFLRMIWTADDRCMLVPCVISRRFNLWLCGLSYWLSINSPTLSICQSSMRALRRLVLLLLSIMSMSLSVSTAFTHTHFHAFPVLTSLHCRLSADEDF